MPWQDPDNPANLFYPFPGEGYVTFTPPPYFEFRGNLLTEVTPSDYDLNETLIYDPATTLGPPALPIRVRDGLSQTQLSNVSICTDVPWLNVEIRTAPAAGPDQCIF